MGREEERLRTRKLMVLELKKENGDTKDILSSHLLIGCGVQRDASKMPKTFEGWVINYRMSNDRFHL